MELFSSPAMWAALGNIILVNIVLSGDNAVVIAMAARGLQGKHQRNAIIWGSAAAIIMRVILTLFAVELLKYPFLKIVGGLLLFWIGIQLLAEGDDDEEQVVGHTALWAAIRTIMVADLVMSLDNVIGVAAAARGHAGLLMIGLAISIPLIIFGSTLMLKLMERFPIIITLGGALLGYLAGDMIADDPAISAWFKAAVPFNDIHLGPNLEFTITGIAGALFVWIVGSYLSRRAEVKSAAHSEKA